VPVYWATLSYKAWARRRREEKGLTFDDLAVLVEKADKRVTCSSSALTQFLVGKKGEPLRPSYSAYMPALNKILGAAQPTIFDPESPIAQVKDQIDYLWRIATPEQRQEILSAAESWLRLITPMIQR